MDFSRIVVLLVEDDDDSRALTSRVLTDVGATVVEAASALGYWRCRLGFRNIL
jgi:CheY-like chemotaxis protein